jgi:hypothetical protein
MTYYTKYLKYKNKYLDLKYYSGNMVGGVGGEYIITNKKQIGNTKFGTKWEHKLLSDEIFIRGPSILKITNSYIKHGDISNLLKDLANKKLSSLSKIYLEKVVSSKSEGNVHPRDYLRMVSLLEIITYSTLNSIELVNITFDLNDELDELKDDFSYKKLMEAQSNPSNITELIITGSIITIKQILLLLTVCPKLKTLTITNCKYVTNSPSEAYDSYKPSEDPMNDPRFNLNHHSWFTSIVSSNIIQFNNFKGKITIE